MVQIKKITAASHWGQWDKIQVIDSRSLLFQGSASRTIFMREEMGPGYIFSLKVSCMYIWADIEKTFKLLIDPGSLPEPMMTY